MMSESATVRFERATLSRLRGLGRRLRVYVLLDGLALVSVALVLAVLITLMVDRTLRLAWDMRLVQLSTLLAAVGLVVWRLMVRPLLAPIRIEHLAVLVERRYPQLRSRLVTAVEFAGPVAMPPGRLVPRSAAMIEAVVAQADEEAAFLRFEDTLNHRRAWWRVSVAVTCLVVLLGMTLAAPQTMSVWFERNVLLADVDWPQRNRLTLEGDDLADGSMTVARGDDVTVSARVDHGYEPPRQVYIRYESESGATGREQMPAVRGDVVRFTHAFERINESLRCQIAGGDAATPWFTLQVVDRPRVNTARLGITPPAYTKVEPYELRAGQTVAEVLAGSQVRFEVTANKPVARAQLIRQIGGETTQVAQAEEGTSATTFSAADRPETSATYHFLLTDEVGLTNVSERVGPVRFTIRLVADRAPTAKMKVKGVGEMITPQAVLPIETDFADEFGLAAAEFVYASSKNEAKPVREPLPGFEPGTRTYAHTLDWPVETHGLTEGDRLSLHAEASDFDNVSGPNVGKSAVIVFRVVNRDELLAELNRREQEYRQDFERLLRQQEELYADLLTLIQAGGAAAEAGKRRDDFVRLARRQRDQAGRLNTLRMQFEQVLSELRVNRLSSPAVENRLGGGVIEPMSHVGRESMPAAAERLDEVADAERPERLQGARGAQEGVLEEMRTIMEQMQKWEGFQEAVILLRDVMKMQRDLSQETETKIESEVLGTRPASGASK